MVKNTIDIELAIYELRAAVEDEINPALGRVGPSRAMPYAIKASWLRLGAAIRASKRK